MNSSFTWWQVVCWSLVVCYHIGCSTPEPASAPIPTTENHDEVGRPEVQSTDDPGDFAETKPADPEVVKSVNEDRVVSGDWPMWGGDPSRNMVNTTTSVSIDFEPPYETRNEAHRPPVDQDGKGKKLIWSMPLGSQTYGPPAIAGGRVFASTNNGGNYRPKHKGDRGCLLCLDEKTGEFLWQLTREKLPQGRVNDWPQQGIVSIPYVEHDRLWVVTNRAELMCVDTEGFFDDENDGPYKAEVDNERQDADIVWNLDMMNDELGVFPHNLAISAPVVHGDLVFIVTGNGVDEAHLEVSTPRAPAFLAVNKHTGEVAWEDNSPFDQILHGQWSSPSIGEVNGQVQVYMAGGDGWLYAFEAESGDLVWKFDLNPKDSKWELGGRGNRNSIIATPVFCEDSVTLAVGQDPEHGEGVGHLYRIDATKMGDVSPELPDGKPNQNSAQIWHYGGVDKDGAITGREHDWIFRRTLSTVAIHDGLVFAADLTGYLHCIDFETGERYWEYDTLAGIWGSPMVVDEKVLLCDEDGDLVILKADKHQQKDGEGEIVPLAEKLFPLSIYSTPTIANGVLFINGRSRLYAFDIQ